MMTGGVAPIAPTARTSAASSSSSPSDATSTPSSSPPAGSAPRAAGPAAAAAAAADAHRSTAHTWQPRSANHESRGLGQHHGPAVLVRSAVPAGAAAERLSLSDPKTQCATKRRPRRSRKVRPSPTPARVPEREGETHQSRRRITAVSGAPARYAMLRSPCAATGSQQQSGTQPTPERPSAETVASHKPTPA